MYKQDPAEPVSNEHVTWEEYCNEVIRVLYMHKRFRLHGICQALDLIKYYPVLIPFYKNLYNASHHYTLDYILFACVQRKENMQYKATGRVKNSMYIWTPKDYMRKRIRLMKYIRDNISSHELVPEIPERLLV